MNKVIDKKELKNIFNGNKDYMEEIKEEHFYLYGWLKGRASYDERNDSFTEDDPDIDSLHEAISNLENKNKINKVRNILIYIKGWLIGRRSLSSEIDYDSASQDPSIASLGEFENIFEYLEKEVEKEKE